MVRWVVFDYGEVISRRTAALPELAAVLDADPEEFEAAYFAERKAYDWGCPDLDYWRAVGSRLDRQVDADLSDRLTRADVTGWLETDPATVRLLEDLHQQGTALALLSNAPSSFGRAVERTDWARLFKHLVFSGDLQLAKPDPRIYRALLETLTTEPPDCLFFDDRQENVEAAREAGLTAELWPGPEAARPLLHTHLTK